MLLLIERIRISLTVSEPTRNKANEKPPPCF